MTADNGNWETMETCDTYNNLSIIYQWFYEVIYQLKTVEIVNKWIPNGQRKQIYQASDVINSGNTANKQMKHEVHSQFYA